MKIIISSNSEQLAAALSRFNRVATVEAEYGAAVVEGNILTLAHHGERGHNPCPCLRANDPIDVDVVGVSHIDLDTLGGIMSIIGIKPENDEFWSLAAHVDINGPHMARTFGASKQTWLKLNAFWAYSENHRVLADRSGKAVEVVLDDFFDVITRILTTDQENVKGQAFIDRGRALNENSFVGMVDRMVIRRYDGFVNHLYGTGDYVLSYNDRTRAITLSKRDSSVPGNCCTIMQTVFGPAAGGHAGIAGSPRSGVPSRDIGRVITEMHKQGLLDYTRVPRALRKAQR